MTPVAETKWGTWLLTHTNSPPLNKSQQAPREGLAWFTFLMGLLCLVYWSLNSQGKPCAAEP